MKKVNLRDLYPDVYKNDHFVEVTEDVLETIRAAERAEAAYDRRMYRYKAHYSLDCDNGIENAILMKPQTPELLLEEKQLREQLYAAVMALPYKELKKNHRRGQRTVYGNCGCSSTRDERMGHRERCHTLQPLVPAPYRRDSRETRCFYHCSDG